MLAVVVALVTTMLVAPEKVEGGSMEPTLSEGQIVVMTKTSYSQKRGSPALNQVVIMKNNVGGELYTDNIIGRVSALPGEKVTMEDGTTITLKADEFYLLCDNEADSSMPDSRALGPVLLKDIRGDAKWVVWPLKDIGGIK